MLYTSTFKASLIYIFAINDSAHRGCLKIGEATLDEHTDLTLPPNCKELNKAAKARIDQYTKTAAIQYTLLHTELTVAIHGGKITAFNDKAVHEVLQRSGIKRHDFSLKNQGREWYECSLETAVKAIQAVKEGRTAISQSEIVPVHEIIEFRPEQLKAIEMTVKKFSTGGKTMLWNAKMRFGKTLSALQVVKECGYHRTIIITHRPVVDEGWFEDFGKIFKEGDGYRYGSREKGFKFEELEADSLWEANHYVYFASMQDLRGAQLAGGKFDKNKGIFAADYDMLIIDEAHEGTQTELGQNVITLLTKKNTHVLNLSGTPFNLLDGYKEDEIFTWDYVMEQKAKAEWDINHFGDPNPYAGLPRLNIFTFDLGKVLSGFDDVEDFAFNFKEFFRTWTGDKERDHRDMPEGMEGRFIHEEHVKSFLDLIVKYDPDSNYPFSTNEFRKAFRHTLWMVPGVKEARALSAMLKQHAIFGQFQVVNVAGDGDEDMPDDDALKLVKDAMGDDPEDTMTITLSCGKLTTGVSVKPWTAVMYLAGSHNTDAKAYMQTIFRVQTPYLTKNGRRKENCYVFDFAPDRTLKVLAETAKVSHRAKSTATEADRVHLGEFLNFCPVIGYNGTHMAEYNVDSMLEQLKRAYISRVTRNGCDDPRLYNQEMLRKLDTAALEKFKDLHKIIGSTKSNHTSTDVDMAKNGLTDEQYEQYEKDKKKKKKELTEEEKRRLEEAKKAKENADAAISILRGISIRLPLLMYGAELKDEEQEITLENFCELIDNQSWEEFMPRKVTKELFREFIPYYDPDMFRAVSRNYRDLVRAADKLAPMERTKAVSEIFDYFRNPDKETVLTPWRVVNMHIGDCIGGWDFYDEDTTTKLLKPKFNDLGVVTEKVFKGNDTRILEINSKTGLYPLYMAYSVFAEKLKAYRDAHWLTTDVPVEKQNEIWDEVLRDNIFVICKTEMAKSITKRTLRGFRKAKVNARYFEDLINKITNQPDLFMMKVASGKNYWKNNNIEEKMRFNAIVGNPPYQIMDGGGTGSSAIPVYNYFVQVSKRLSPHYISMIMPAKWYSGGKGLDEFRDDMIHDKRMSSLFDYEDSRDCFANVDIAGGVCYFLWDDKHHDKCKVTTIANSELKCSYRDLDEFETFIRHDKAVQIIHKIQSFGEATLDQIVYSRKPFGFSSNDIGASEPFKGAVELFGSQGTTYVNADSVSVNKDLLNKWKVIMSKTSAEHAGQSDKEGRKRIISRLLVLNPNTVCSESYLLLSHFDTKEEAENMASYVRTNFFRFLLSTILLTQNIAKDKFAFIPVQSFNKPWSDKDLYVKYHLSLDEIEYIESRIKPMTSEELFDSTELLNPELGNFNLSEYGAEVGDKIIYTPLDMEVSVLEDNKVSYGDEKYTLPEFTAKFMPRNKRSVSGVCQGPKYFTKGGVTLYKLKESFLGGKKK